MINFIADDEQDDSSVNLNCDGSNGIKVCGVTFGIYSYEQKEGNFEVSLRNIEVICYLGYI